MIILEIRISISQVPLPGDSTAAAQTLRGDVVETDAGAPAGPEM